MTKDVFVSICGLHFTDDGQDPTELIVPGNTISGTGSIIFCMKRL